jgi:hypothetical protein
MISKHAKRPRLMNTPFTLPFPVPLLLKNQMLGNRRYQLVIISELLMLALKNPPREILYY